MAEGRTGNAGGGSAAGTGGTAAGGGAAGGGAGGVGRPSGKASARSSGNRSAPAAYLLFGPEQGEKAEYLDHIRKVLEKHNGEAPEEYRFYGSDSRITEVIPTLRTGSLFSAHRLVIFQGAEQITAKEDSGALKEYLQAPPEDATLVLITDENRILTSSRKEPDWVKQIPKEFRKIFWEMFDNQKKGWVVGQCRKLGVEIEHEAVDLLLELVENNTQALGHELQRLASFVGRGQRISADEVERYLYHSREESVFTLFDAIAAADFERALEILETLQLSSQNQPVQILAGLLWQYRRLRDLRALANQHYEIAEAFRMAGIKGKKVQRSYEQALSHYGKHDLDRILALGTDYDTLLRSGLQGIGDGLLQQFLYYAMIRKGQRVEAGPVASD
jgi:DNA polymerase-3 subunit delta